MLRFYDYCPKCQGIRSMSISISLRKVAGSRDGEEEILVHNFHCDACDSFVSSATVEELKQEKAAQFVIQPSAIMI